ncbi:MAG: putative ABC transporter permease [Lachnospiraceae bacterium]|nr:putative ABC transporter permease [Lachnospiraceae bacterium]
MEYLYTELLLFFMLYSFIGWAGEVVITSVTRCKFCNRGFLNMPLCPKYGVMADLLILVLPTVGEELSFRNLMTQYIIALVITSVVEFIASDMTHRLLHRRLSQYERDTLFGGEMNGAAVALAKTAVILVIIKLLHPFILTFTRLLPLLLLQVAVPILLGLLVLDMVSVIYAGKVRQRRKTGERKGKKSGKKSGTEGMPVEIAKAMSGENLGNRLCSAVWKRLARAYPGMGEWEDIRSGKYVFAKGLCLNKLLWIFIIWAFIGDLFETVLVRVTTGVWMSRTSVIYGTFSIVWGLGAVIITIVTQKLVNREDRFVFLSGAALWGVYEYTCSVISEFVFGRTFWDYSDMMFNIGGRTNLLFCFFGGVLSVLWVKILYPLISDLIEKIHPAIGVIATWAVIVVMAADLLLSGAVLSRYVNRLEGAEAQNVLEEFIDANYSDEFVESIWPNMHDPESGTPIWQQETTE